MILRTFLALLLLAPVSSASAQGTLLNAVQALPAADRDRVFRVSADNGQPDPGQWYFTVRGNGGLRSITVQNQEIIGDKRTLDLRTLVTDPAPINFGRVTVDSPGAWAAAEKYVAGKGRKLGTVSYVLEQKGSAATPVWSVWSYDPAGSYIGLITLSAATGEILSSE